MRSVPLTGEVRHEDERGARDRVSNRMRVENPWRAISPGTLFGGPTTRRRGRLPGDNSHSYDSDTMVHYVTILAGIAAIHWAALISPGPNFLLISQASSAESRRAGLWTALGVVIGTITWATTALLGVSVILSQFAWVYKGMKFVGGAYLVYLGVRAWLGATKPLRPEQRVSTGPQHWLALRRGLLTHITNPKTALFYAGIFATTLTPGLPQWVKAAAFGVVLADSLIWHSTLALVFSTDRAQRAYLRAKRWVDRITGTVMTAFGAGLALG